MVEQSWIQIAKELGVFTVLSGLITFLISQIFSKYFNRQVELFNSQLRHKYYRLEKLHEKRIEVIIDLYKDIVDLEGAIQIMTAMIKPADNDFEEMEKKRIFNAGNAYNKVYMCFREHEILFPAEFCSKMNTLIKASFDIVNGYQFYTDFNRRNTDLYRDVLKKVNNELPTVKQSLKTQLRKLMEVENGSESTV